MPQDAEMLSTIKSQALQIIADITVAPKPTYYIDGQSVAWERYLAQLQSTVDWCDARLRDVEPFEIHSRGET